MLLESSVRTSLITHVSASVRAYRSRFDKWRVNKYNIVRRRSATATMAAGYGPAVVTRTGGDGVVGVEPGGSFWGAGVQGESAWPRHFSAPSLPFVQGW